MANPTLFVLDDNEKVLEDFKNYQTNKLVIQTFSEITDFFKALKSHQSQKIVLLDLFFKTENIADILADLSSFELKDLKVWLLTGKESVDIKALQEVCAALQDTWFQKPIRVEEVINKVLGITSLSDDEAQAIVNEALLFNPLSIGNKEPVKLRIVDENGSILKSFGDLPYTGENLIRKEVYEQAFKEGAFSDERFVPLKKSQNQSVRYYEVTNIPTTYKNKRYLLQLFMPKETPFFRFEREEEYFKETSKKILQALRYAGFSRARLYAAKHITKTQLKHDTIAESQEGLYYALQVVGHENENCFYEKGRLWSAAEHAIIDRTQKAFESQKEDGGKLIFEIVDTGDQKDNSEWYNCFKKPKQYLFLPIFDQQGKLIMAIKCDRYGIKKMGTSDYTENIKEKEILASEEHLLSAVDMLRKHFQNKRRIVFNKYQGQLLKKILNISPDSNHDEDEILEKTIQALHETLGAFDEDKKSDRHPKLEGMWLLKLDDGKPKNTLAIHGELPKAFHNYDTKRYQIINAFLDIVKKHKHDRLDIPYFDERCSWYQFVQNQEIDEIQKEWYENLQSLYFRNIYVNGKLKAVLIFYSKDPYYLSDHIDRLVSLAIEKCRLTLEVHAKNTERIMLTREMVHDIKSPLNALRTLQRQMQEKNDPHAKKIALYLQSLQSNIDDLSTLGSLDRGILIPRQDSIDLAKFIADIAELFKPLALEKHLDFGYRIEEGVPKTIQSDPNLLGHILSNLIENAISYTDIGSVRIKVLKKDEKTLAIQIIDTGKKMDQNQIDHMFELPESSQKQYRNTGLGLYIVKRLVDLLGLDLLLIQDEMQENGKYFEVILPIQNKNETFDMSLEIETHQLTYDKDELKQALKALNIEPIARQAYRATTKAKYRILAEAMEDLDGEFHDFYREFLEDIETFKFKQLDEKIKYYWGIDDDKL